MDHQPFPTKLHERLLQGAFAPVEMASGSRILDLLALMPTAKTVGLKILRTSETEYADTTDPPRHQPEIWGGRRLGLIIDQRPLITRSSEAIRT